MVGQPALQSDLFNHAPEPRAGSEAYTPARAPLAMVPPPAMVFAPPRLVTAADVEESNVTLRPYQKEVVAEIENGFAYHSLKSQRLVLPTGVGKTIAFSTFAKRQLQEKARVLILVHRDTLLKQAAEKLGNIGLTPLIEKAEQKARPFFAYNDPHSRLRLVLASKDSMQGPRLTAWPRDAFDYIISDECFPAGTKVDGKSIEEIRIGDFVKSFNHQTGNIEKRRVKHLFKNPVKQLVRVRLSDGRSIVCTPGHPFCTQNGYVPALKLTYRDWIYNIPKDTKNYENPKHENEGRVFDTIRVDSVEILEQGSAGGFGEVCPNGFVYNIEVEGNQNYFVENILVHNCHHVQPGNSWDDIIKHFHTAKHLGVTATPGKMHKGKYVYIPGFDRDIEPLQLFDAIQQGFLAPILIKACETNIDLRAVGMVAGDFAKNALDKVIYDNTNRLATAIKEHIGTRPTLAFTPLIKSSEALAAALNDIGVTAEHICGVSADPDQIYARHKRGDFQVLTNSLLCTEGVDLPYIECVAIARPTRSINLYCQQVGRGTRLSEDTGKKNCLVLDFGFTSGLPLVGLSDLARSHKDDSAETDEVMQEARRILEEAAKDGADIMQIMADARQAVAERKERERIRAERLEQKRLEQLRDRAKYQEQKFAYRVRTFDPSTTNLLGIPEQQAREWSAGIEPATNSQCQFIERLSKGRIKTEKLSKQTASAIIAELKGSIEEGRASYGQRQLMVTRLGCDPDTARNMSFEDAKVWIEHNKNWP